MHILAITWPCYFFGEFLAIMFLPKYPSDPLITAPSPFPFWAAAPKGPMTYAFTYAEIFPKSVHPPSLEAQIPVPRPKSQSRGPNPIRKAQILASRPKS